MLFRTINGTIVNVERHDFTSDREYYTYIKTVVTGKVSSGSKENIVDRLAKLIKQS
jgi:hypothetical protein